MDLLIYQIRIPQVSEEVAPWAANLKTVTSKFIALFINNGTCVNKNKTLKFVLSSVMPKLSTSMLLIHPQCPTRIPIVVKVNLRMMMV
jgi:hypothetical protein